MAKKGPTKAQLKAEQREQLLAALRACRTAGTYPLRISDLATQAGVPTKAAISLLTDEVGKLDVLVAKQKTERAPVALRADATLLAESDLLLSFVAEEAKAKRQAVSKPLAAKPQSLFTDGKVDASLKDAFIAKLQRRITTGLPSNVAELVAIPPPPKLKPPPKPKRVPAPPTPKPAEVAAKLVTLIQSQRDAAADLYPVTAEQLKRLAANAGLTGDVSIAIANSGFKTKAFEITAATGKQYVLANDLSWLVAAGLSHAAQESSDSTAFHSTDIAGAIVSGPQKKWLTGAIDSAADRAALPAEVAWLRQKGKRLFFLRSAVEPAQNNTANSAPHTPDIAVVASANFRDQFEGAFGRVDARTGRRNFVKLLDVRKELPNIDRQSFDAGLRELRIAQLFTLNSSEGGAVQLTPEERDAGVREGSSLLVYVSRR